MSAIASINANQVGPIAAAISTLTADDTITVNSAKKQMLLLTNTTGGSLTCTVDGDGASTVSVPGVGAIDVSGGKAIVVGAGLSVAVILGSISAYCKGVVHLLGGTGLKAQLFDM